MSKTVIVRGGEQKWGVVKMHLKSRDQQLKIITHTHSVYMAIYKPHGNHKPKTYNTYTYKKRERNRNITLNIVIESREENKRRNNNKKRTTKTAPKQLTKWQ